MKPILRNFVVDAVVFTLFVCLTTTGILMRYTLPPGAGRQVSVLGLDRHDWGALHFYLALALLAALAVHLFLHWRWFRTVAGGRAPGAGRRLALGVVGALGLVALAAAPLLAPVDDGGAAAGTGLPIRGNTSLARIQAVYAIGPAELRRVLDLPPDTPDDATLDELGERHGLRLSRVRRMLGRIEARSPPDP